jgi:hypothetical protein
VDAEEDLEALQEQTFTRVQMMQEQITGLLRRVCTHTKRRARAQTAQASVHAHSHCQRLVTRDCFFPPLVLPLLDPRTGAALRAENQSLRAEVQQINRTVRTRNMPLCPACNRVNLQVRGASPPSLS